MKMPKAELQEFIRDPRAYMARGYNIKKNMSAKQDRIAGWRKIAEVTIAAPRKDKAGKPGHTKRQLEDIICAIDELEGEILDEIQELIEIERSIMLAIRVLLQDNTHKIIMELRYLNNRSWREVGSRLHYTDVWVCRQHSAALELMKQQAIALELKK